MNYYKKSRFSRVSSYSSDGQLFIKTKTSHTYLQGAHVCQKIRKKYGRSETLYLPLAQITSVTVYKKEIKFLPLLILLLFVSVIFCFVTKEMAWAASFVVLYPPITCLCLIFAVFLIFIYLLYRIHGIEIDTPKKSIKTELNIGRRAQLFEFADAILNAQEYQLGTRIPRRWRRTERYPLPEDRLN